METNMIEQLEPQLVDRLMADPSNVATASLIAAKYTVPIALGVLATSAFGQSGLPQDIADVLNFALTLEELEDQFYKAGLSAKKLIPDTDHKVFETIGKHESEHVKLLKGVLGSQAGPAPKADPTGSGTFADVLTNYATFQAVAQTFEDTGVRAYKGQAGNLMSNKKLLTVALTIHSVEARHAAEIRRLRGVKPWIVGGTGAKLPAAAQASYAGEDNVTQGGVDLTGLGGLSMDAITGAFDEPLTKEQVLAIVKPFIAG
jgi:rubrerythrin